MQIVGAIGGLQHMSQTLDERRLDAAVDLLAAMGVHLLAARRSFPVVSYLAYALAQLERRITLLDGVGGMNDGWPPLAPRDLLLVVSFRSYTPEVIEIAHRRTAAASRSSASPTAGPRTGLSNAGAVAGRRPSAAVPFTGQANVLAQSLVIARTQQRQAITSQWSAPVNRRLDVVYVGRAAVDLYGEQIGATLQEVSTFALSRRVAGNTAVGCARLGLRAAMLTRRRR
jgi:hypothetical protein